MQRREINRKIREWELDLAIDNCTDPVIKDLCEQLKALRV